jgi:hypothetical protein
MPPESGPADPAKLSAVEGYLQEAFPNGHATRSESQSAGWLTFAVDRGGLRHELAIARDFFAAVQVEVAARLRMWQVAEAMNLAGPDRLVLVRARGSSLWPRSRPLPPG